MEAPPLPDNEKIILRSAPLPEEYSTSNKDATFVMDVSPSVVGWIIGRSGLRIKEIQSQTGCKMWLDQDVPDDQPRKIYFHGSTVSIENAVARVSELVQFAPILANSKIAAGHNLTSTIFDCPPALVGMVIGKKGWTIKKIQEVSGAQISINQSVREGLPRKVIVSGDDDAVSQALELIGDLVRDKASLLKIELPAVLTAGRTNRQHLRSQSFGRQNSSPTFQSSSGAIHQDPYLIFADHEPPAPSSYEQHTRRPPPSPSASVSDQAYFSSADYHPQPLYRGASSHRGGAVDSLPLPPSQDLVRLHSHQRHNNSGSNRPSGTSPAAASSSSFPVSDTHPSLTSALLQHRPHYYNYPALQLPSPSSGHRHGLPSLSSSSADHTLQHSSSPSSRLYQQGGGAGETLGAHLSDATAAARRSVRSHSAGSLAHYYDLEERESGGGDQHFQQAHAHLPPSSLPSTIPGHFPLEDLRAPSKRGSSSSAQRIFFSQPLSQDPHSPQSIGRGYSFASSKSEFHSFETTEAVSLASPSSDSYRRHNAIYPMTRSSEGFTSGEYSEAEHNPPFYPPTPVQLDLPAWHSFHRAKDGAGGGNK
jgi:predicted RNA-binding protein YlqC (UPF0109 family)